MKKLKIVTTAGEFEFIGKHLPELEKTNWHYYEDENGKTYHFRKQLMVAVIEGG